MTNQKRALHCCAALFFIGSSVVWASLPPAAVVKSEAGTEGGTVPTGIAVETEDLAIQAFPSALDPSQSSQQATRALAKRLFGKQLPKALKREQFKWKGSYRDGPHVTLAYVRYVPKDLVGAFKLAIKHAIADDLANFKFTIDEMSFLDGSYWAMDGKWREGAHLIFKPDQATMDKAKALHEKILSAIEGFKITAQVPAQFVRKLPSQASTTTASESAVVDALSVDPKTNAENYRPHITVWNAWGERSEELKEAYAKKGWRFYHAPCLKDEDREIPNFFSTLVIE